MRGVTACFALSKLTRKISTHTPHARRDGRKHPLFAALLISTHTPHARRDGNSIIGNAEILISTHTPHARRDDWTKSADGLSANFNSHASCEA